VVVVVITGVEMVVITGVEVVAIIDAEIVADVRFCGANVVDKSMTVQYSVTILYLFSHYTKLQTVQIIKY